MEAASVTGPAKNLLNFSENTIALPAEDGLPQVSVSVATYQRGEPGDGTPNVFAEAARKRNVPMDVLFERFRFDRRLIPQIRELVQRISPQIVQTHNVKSHFLIKWAGLYRERPWIAFQHGYTATDLKMKLYNQLDRWSLRSADRVVTVCNPFADRLVEFGVRRDRIRVLHNSAVAVEACSPEEIRVLREKLGIGENTRVLLTVGRFSYEKGHLDLMAALAHLRRLRPELDFKQVLVGDGPEQANMEKAIGEAGLSAHVVFAGHQSDVLPFFNLADVLVLPSHSEGSPNVILEAMATGLPIVATAVGGVPEMVSGGESGILTPARQPEALGEGIARMLASPDVARQYARKASETLRQRFSPEAYRRALLGVYAEVLRAREA